MAAVRKEKLVEYEDDKGVKFFAPENASEQELDMAAEKSRAPKPSGRRTLFGMSEGAEENFFPQASKVKGGFDTFGDIPKSIKEGTFGKGLKQTLKKGVKGALDLTEVPSRFLGMARGRDFGTSGEGILRPEIDKLKGAIPGEGLPSKLARGGVEVAGSILQDPLSVGAGGVKALGKGAAKAADNIGLKLGEMFSGASKEALDVASSKAGRVKLAKAAGTQKEIGDELAESLDRVVENMPEVEKIDVALKNMGEVNVANTIETLKKAKPGLGGRATQSDELAADLIDDQITRIERIAPDGTMPAPEFKELRIRLDKTIGRKFGEEAPEFITALKKTRHQMADDLITAAKTTGNPDYVENMKVLADVLKKAEKVSMSLGKNASTREARAEAFVANLFGKNKKARQQAVKDLESVLGKDFMERSKLAFLAAEFGAGGVPGFLPRGSARGTLSGLATIGAGAKFGPAGAAIATSSSPFAVSRLSGLTKGVGKGIDKSGKALQYIGEGATTLGGLRAMDKEGELRSGFSVDIRNPFRKKRR